MKKNRFIKTLFRHIIIWTIAFLIFNFLREFGHKVIRRVESANSFSLIERLAFQLVIGFVSGVLFGSYQFLFKKLRKIDLSLGKLIIYGSFGYSVVIVVFILLVFYIFGLLFTNNLDSTIVWEYFSSGEAWVLIFYCFIVGFIIEFVQEVDKKFGPGNLRKMLAGQFYRPKEEERIFMFLDMKSSTTIAEKIGHIKYSKLVQDCFKAISIVTDYYAEIYQYVGDETVLTWKTKKGIKDNNCIEAYFAFDNLLKSKRDYFMEEYGVFPEFKAGLNLGIVTVAEVGEIKREIAYHGDTINTAARIQSKCNEYNKKLLVSDSVLHAINLDSNWLVNQEGEVALKGKSAITKIYSIWSRENS